MAANSITLSAKETLRGKKKTPCKSHFPSEKNSQVTAKTVRA